MTTELAVSLTTDTHTSIHLAQFDCRRMNIHKLLNPDTLLYSTDGNRLLSFLRAEDEQEARWGSRQRGWRRRDGVFLLESGILVLRNAI